MNVNEQVLLGCLVNKVLSRTSSPGVIRAASPGKNKAKPPQKFVVVSHCLAGFEMWATGCAMWTAILENRKGE